MTPATVSDDGAPCTPCNTFIAAIISSRSNSDASQSIFDINCDTGDVGAVEGMILKDNDVLLESYHVVGGEFINSRNDTA